MNNPAVIENALEYIDAMLTPDEIRESNLRVEIIGEQIKEQLEKASIK